MHYFKSSVLLLILCFIAFNLEAQEISQNKINEAIDSLIHSTIQTHDIPAISIGVIQDGKISIQKGYGYTKRQTGVPVDENTVYQIASLSKMFTGIIARSLILENKLVLNQSISFYLKDKIDSKTAKKLSTIQVKDIFFHRSGIPRNSKTHKRRDGEPMLSKYTEKHLLADLKKMKIRKYGKFKYSNLGYSIIGYILESASGLTYEELCKQYVIQKFNLVNTTISNPFQSATPYRKDNRTVETKAWNTGKMTPASGIYSTTADLSKLMVEQLKAYRSNPIDKDTNPLNLTNPKELKGNSNNSNSYYGMGLWELKYHRGMLYGHSGDMDGFASQYQFNSTQDTGVVLLTSSGGPWLGILIAQINQLIENNKSSTVF